MCTPRDFCCHWDGELGTSFGSTTLWHPYCTWRPNFWSSAIYQFPRMQFIQDSLALTFTDPSELLPRSWSSPHITRGRRPWNLLRSYFHDMCHRKERYSWHLSIAGPKLRMEKRCKRLMMKSTWSTFKVCLEDLRRKRTAVIPLQDFSWAEEELAKHIQTHTICSSKQSSSMSFLKNLEMALSDPGQSTFLLAPLFLDLFKSLVTRVYDFNSF